MATHELYIGGPPTRNYSQAMFPAVPFNEDGPGFQIGPAAHKGPIGYADTRLLDFGADHALSEFLRENTVEDGDLLGVVLIPRRVLFLGFYYRIETPVEGLSLTPQLRDRAGTFTAINAAEVGEGFVAAGGGAAVEEGTLDLGQAVYSTKPYMLDLEITAVGADGIGGLKMIISPVLLAVDTGGFR